MKAWFEKNSISIDNILAGIGVIMAFISVAFALFFPLFYQVEKPKLTQDS